MGATGPMPGGRTLAKKKKKKKTKKKRQELEDPSLREHLLAGAYGGIAKPKPKRDGIKYTTDINAGLRDLVTPNAMQKELSRRNINPHHLGQGSLSNFEGQDSGRRPRHRGNMSDTSSRIGGGGSQHRQLGGSGSKLLDPS